VEDRLNNELYPGLNLDVLKEVAASNPLEGLVNNQEVCIHTNTHTHTHTHIHKHPHTHIDLHT
jgi:hypothetical protein